MKVAVIKLFSSLIDKGENMIIRSPKLLGLVIEITPSIIFEKLSQIKAISIFHKSVDEVPAYQSYLQENGCQPNAVSSYDDFLTQVPVTTKESYIYRYPLMQRCRQAELPSGGNIDESAGSSGKATMWIRSTKEEKKLSELINFGLDYSINSKKRNDIVVLNCWSTGPWATGVKFSFIAQHSTTVKSVGTDKENAIQTIKELGNKFEYLLCGYPPFIKEIIDYGEEEGMKWDDYRVTVLTGGEGFSEGWRNYMRKKINGYGGEVYSAYGASDIDIGIGFETDFTIAIKQLADKDRQFRKRIFGRDQMPTFFGVYNPLSYHLENAENEEILFTALNHTVWSPKIRYNLRDSGRVFKHNELIKLVRESKHVKVLDLHHVLRLPYLVVFGRSDGTISLDGGNIYPNDVQDALFKSKFAKSINSFFIAQGYTEDKSINFQVHVELIPGYNPEDFSDKKETRLAVHIRKQLMKSNQDYKECWENNPESLEPRIIWHKYGEDMFSQNKERIKNIYHMKSS